MKMRPTFSSTDQADGFTGDSEMASECTRFLLARFERQNVASVFFGQLGTRTQDAVLRWGRNEDTATHNSPVSFSARGSAFGVAVSDIIGLSTSEQVTRFTTMPHVASVKDFGLVERKWSVRGDVGDDVKIGLLAVDAGADVSIGASFAGPEKASVRIADQTAQDVLDSIRRTWHDVTFWMMLRTLYTAKNDPGALE